MYSNRADLHQLLVEFFFDFKIGQLFKIGKALEDLDPPSGAKQFQAAYPLVANAMAGMFVGKMPEPEVVKALAGVLEEPHKAAIWRLMTTSQKEAFEHLLPGLQAYIAEAPVWKTKKEEAYAILAQLFAPLYKDFQTTIDAFLASLEASDRAAVFAILTPEQTDIATDLPSAYAFRKLAMTVDEKQLTSIQNVLSHTQMDLLWKAINAFMKLEETLQGVE